MEWINEWIHETEREKTHNFWKELSRLHLKQETAKDRETGEDTVDEKDFLEVYLMADHESQTESPHDAGREEDVVIPNGGYRIYAIGESAQRNNKESV